MFGRDKQKVKRKTGYSRWKKAGLIIVVLIAGLAVGGAAGYFIQDQFKSTNADKAEETSPEVTEQSEEARAEEVETAPEAASSVPAEEVPAAPVVYGKTPAEAMSAYLEALGVEPEGMMYSVVATSKSDSNWKLDKGVKSGEETLYFIVHYTPEGWTVVFHDTSISSEQVESVGAPADILPQVD